MTTSLPFVLANHGFALNFNPFETNLINLVLVIVLLVYFLKGFLGDILELIFCPQFPQLPPFQIPPFPMPVSARGWRVGRGGGEE